MKFASKLGLVAIGGLALGLGIRHNYERQPERAIAAVELFRAVCVPVSKLGDVGSAPDLSDLVPVGIRQSWADPKSQFVLELTSSHCSISDVLLHMNSEERDQFAALTTALVASEFPMLTLDDSHGLTEWDAFQLWSQFERDDSRRWGVTLSRFSSEETDLSRVFDQSNTVLKVNFVAK
ncbi:hypothetical protein [Phaeobacter porticola]|uniref:Uncharacterized protein n=1 Tax=Phaeobacter porticola TaxID=1844006 RepID=A0A1L3I577_9RHOB|nr:hypothetical protein [Phaeobacter porticola]APG47192.1 hypothetical protein PhaeoP97_01779 [Phaeobacter porticola]